MVSDQCEALAIQGMKLCDYLRCHTAPFIEERDKTAAIKAMKLTRKSQEFGCAKAEERREAAAAARVLRIIKTRQCSQ